MLLSLAKKSFFLQSQFINWVSRVHPSIEHNIAKIQMLKRAFYHCDLERIEGAYLEFGVFEGTSFLAALKLNERFASCCPRNFYGFDSFDEGFKYFDDQDKHPFFKEGEFKSSLNKVLRRLRKHKNQQLIPGYFEETVQGKSPLQVLGRDEKVAIIFIDCDLMGPALIALTFAKTMLQPGSIVILDDYWAYKGSTELGTCGALQTFLKGQSEIKMRDYYPYGHGGMSFVVTSA